MIMTHVALRLKIPEKSKRVNDLDNISRQRASKLILILFMFYNSINIVLDSLLVCGGTACDRLCTES